MTSHDKTLRDSETPRCDASAYCVNINLGHFAVPVGIAEKIEKELNAANAEIADLKAKLATARDDAIESVAAEFVGLNEYWYAGVAAFIRSLKSSSGGGG